jgi:hypothetical protein
MIRQNSGAWVSTQHGREGSILHIAKTRFRCFLSLPITLALVGLVPMVTEAQNFTTLTEWPVGTTVPSAIIASGNNGACFAGLEAKIGFLDMNKHVLNGHCRQRPLWPARGTSEYLTAAVPTASLMAAASTEKASTAAASTAPSWATSSSG